MPLPKDRQLYVFDPVALHSILLKDQDLYEEPPELMSVKSLPFGTGILSTDRDEHACFARDGLIAPNLRTGPKAVDLFPVFGRLALELIGRTGIQPCASCCDPTMHELSLFMPFLPLIVKILFPSFRRFMINLVPLPPLRRLCNLVDTTHTETAQLVAERKAAIQSGELYVKEDAKDIMSLLISVKSNMSAGDAIHLADELVASTAMIIFAATDTTSGALSRIFHILALHPEVQDKILAAPEHLDHDALVALPYLDAFVREVLRLFPPVSPGVSRETSEDTVLPLSTSIVGVDGTPMSTITAERWMHGKAEAATTKTCGIYGNMMTFIGGGRSCIGVQFSQLEMKAVLCVFLHAFTFSAPESSIKWRMTGAIQGPNVDGQPRLPIRIERRKVE
ncbi:cytochrome P450 [Mycena rosella]|uniref:Cytochrome P450 n=1 Tax=Mycena rosella TaxID=1033263 RepID=A0AAD7CWH9_MYCRO|nr:cytochrome P450 [Mycena rosella]